jgi:hypothetical protein
MASRPYQAFIAYPAQPADLTSPIAAAAEALGGQLKGITVWPALAPYGANIPDEVRNAIRECDVFFADITRPNLNVYYEIGFAIGLGKTFLPIINGSFANSTSSAKSIGLFANIGYQVYDNNSQLAQIIGRTPKNPLLDLYSQGINYSQPVYLLDTLKKTDFRNAVVSAVKSSRSHFRSFDPVETPRISVVQLVAEISSSSGVIIPYLGEHVVGSDLHNLRGALIAGLANGLGRQSLIVTDQKEDVGPTDYNEEIIVAPDQSRIFDVVSSFCSEAVLAAQEIPSVASSANRSVLQNLTLGASAAENEFRDLSSYFVETSEYLRAARGEVSIITGRKGTGKSAIFFQVRDNARRRKGGLTVDLKPESHQLSLFREQIVSTAGVGILQHTIAAFWYFVCLSEMLLTIYRSMEVSSKYDGKFILKMTEIENIFEEYQILVPGDFTSRLTRLSTLIAREVKDAVKGGRSLSVSQVTNMIYKKGIGKIRDLIIENTPSKHPIVFLFDNIDKGWLATGVDSDDVMMVRILIESLNKIRHDFAAKDRDFFHTVFIRHDIYDLMLDQTSDRGKSGQVSIDWTDRAKLTHVIYKRLQVGLSDKRSTMSELWQRIFPRQVNGRDSLDYLIDHSLMRPRFLINLVDGAVANAINRGHTMVSEDDCRDAVRQHSLYLVDDFGFEMRDVSGVSSDVLYGLIDVKSCEIKSDLKKKLENSGFGGEADIDIIELMLWYGILGVPDGDESGKFIYDYQYNMKRLKAAFGIVDDNTRFAINPALHVGLTA